MKFVKINNFWWEIEDDKLYNMVGGHQLADWYKIEDEDVVEVNDWKDLDWIGTEIYDDTLKTGWINRDGKFFGCGSQWHSRQSEFIHNKTERELELLGWIKVYRSNVFESKNKNGYDFIIVSNRINELQKNKLNKLGFTDEEIAYNGG